MPTEKAHGLQIVQNCEALAAHGPAVTFYPARRSQSPELRGVDPFTYYGVPPTFTIRPVPTLDLLPLFGGWSDAGERLSFLIQLASYNAALWAILRKTGPDAIFYTRHTPVLEIVRRYKPARRIFWEVHSLSPSPDRRRRGAARINQIGGAIVITRHMAESLIALGADPSRIIVAPDGIRAARFASPPPMAEARAALGLPVDAFIVGYMGRLHTLNMEKGVGDLVRAIARRPDLPLHLLLVGGPEEMAAQYGAEWRGLGLPAERFHTLGHLPATDVPRALAAFDVTAMPFPWTEHFAYYASPIKLFEYMASERPIVATDLPSTAEIVQDGETALLTPPSDVDALAAALARLYGDPALRARLAAAARRLVFERYTWEARASQILRFIDEKQATEGGQ